LSLSDLQSDFHSFADRCRSFRRRDGRIKAAPTRCAQPAAFIKAMAAANLQESRADAGDNAAGRTPPKGVMNDELEAIGAHVGFATKSLSRLIRADPAVANLREWIAMQTIGPTRSIAKLAKCLTAIAPTLPAVVGQTPDASTAG
jgi:hypothetical protein